MSIGEVLEHARRQAGLSVTEVSQRTRIRETIIAGIEADDYSACGGDFYARGHIRAIARVAGIDSEPLIEEYDAARRPPPDVTDEFPAPPASGRRGRRGRGGGAAFGGGLAQGGGAGQGGSAGSGDRAGVSDSAVRSRGSGLGGWLGRGGRDRWEDDQRAGNNGLDEPGEPEPDRWPGLGWLGRGYGTDQDAWDSQPRHAPEPPPGAGASATWRDPDPIDPDHWDEQLAQDSPGSTYEPARGNPTDWNDPDSGDTQRWDQLGHPADEPAPGNRADWRDPDPIDPEHWDDTGELDRDEPAQAEPEPPGRAARSEPDPGDAGRWDEPPDQDGPSQVDETSPEPGSGTGWSDAPIDPDHWDEELAHDGPGQAAGSRPESRAGWAEADPGDPDGWDAGQLGRGGPGRADGPVRRGGLVSWLGLGDRDGGGPRRGQMVTTWAVLAAVIGFAIYSFVFAAGHRSSATGPHRSHTLQAAARHHGRHKAPSPSASPSATPTPAVPLRPASATAFGIGGTGRGDDPGQAGLAIDHSLATAWRSDWYASAHFGNLYSGTGLLVDMGHPVTITSARVRLGPARGTSLALRVGNLPTLAGLHTAAAASNTGGVVNLNPRRPVRGRYVLIWLTNLPRDPAGTYQANIFNIVLGGQP